MNEEKLKQIQKLLDTTEANVKSARAMLNEMLGTANNVSTSDHKEGAKNLAISNEGKIVEGIFDGLEMVAPDGKKYPVPANYASKSKLVEGDTLKLTIAENGSFTFKQINPVERRSLIGTLAYENGDYFVLSEGKKYKVLLASVSFYKGKAGDKAAIIVPKDTEALWAALESIIHDHEDAKKDETAQKPVSEIEGSRKNDTEPQNTVASTPSQEPQKINLSDENTQILENLRKSLSHHEANGSTQVPSDIPEQETEEESQTPPLTSSADNETAVDEVAEILTDDAPVDSKNILNASSESSNTPSQPEEVPYDSTGEPQIIKHDTFVPEMGEDSFVENETEKNSMGEELKKDVPGMQNTSINELEI